MSQADTFASLSLLLRKGLGDALSPNAETLLDMMSEDVLFEFPFPMPGGLRQISGKAALEAYLPKVGDVLEIDSMSLARAFLSESGTNAVLEFNCKGRSKLNDARYDQDYVSVIDLRDGLISRYRDYWNPLIAMGALADDKRGTAFLKGTSYDA